MSELRWEKIRSIIGRSLELEGEERVQFLDEACGNDAKLRQEIEEFLLRGGTSDDPDFLEPPSLPPLGKDGFVLGDFELLRELGRGGMGVVYLATQRGLGREVAVKVLVEGPSTTETAVERFHREARAVARLRHPGIVQVIADGQTGKTHWFAMEYVPGHDLAREIELQRTGHLLPGVGAFLPRLGSPHHLFAVARACADIAEALHFAHVNGLVHRDIKPHNILIQPDGRVQIADFGLVRDELLGSLTQPGELAGTLHYMSPEQARIRKSPVDHRTDMYSLGVVLYELATLVRPFEGATSAEVLTKILREEPRSMRRINPRVPRDLETICIKAMAKDPRNRYEDTRALAADLRRFLNHEAIEATPPTLVDRARSTLRRHQRPAAAVVLLAVGLGLGSWFTIDRVRAAERASLWASASDENDQPVAGTVSVRAIDLVTGIPGPRRDLGSLPLEDAAIPTGEQRFVLDLGAAGVREFTRDPAAGGEVRIIARVHDTKDANAEMVHIDGGTMRARDGITVSPLEGRTLEIEPFLLDACEVSIAQYRRFLGETGRAAPPHWSDLDRAEYNDLPIAELGWRDAQAYSEWAGKRLPTFAEWMWAARGPENRLYPWAVTERGEWRGNVSKPSSSPRALDAVAHYLASVEAVQSHENARTPDGLYHMLGNVAEWTETPFSEWTPERFLPREGLRLVAYTAWNTASQEGFLATLPAFAQHGMESTYADFRIGFRCAKSER